MRNLIRQAKVEQVYSIMQTNTSRGMQTMEQALADLALRRVINLDAAFEHTNRRDILAGILERAGIDVTAMLVQLELNPSTMQQQPAGGCASPGARCERLDLEEGDQLRHKREEPPPAVVEIPPAPSESVLDKRLAFERRLEATLAAARPVAPAEPRLRRSPTGACAGRGGAGAADLDLEEGDQLPPQARRRRARGARAVRPRARV